MSWDKITLGSIAEFRNGINFDKSSFGKGIKVINVSAFKDRLIPHYDSLPEINPDGIIKKDDILHNSDILFVRSNGNKELVGRSMFIDDIQEQITFSGFCIRCRFKTKDIHPLFYAYLFKGQLIRSELSNSSNGTNITNLNQTLLNNLGVPKPPLETQKRIASILSTYDDLIENNLKRIKLLEETAQNIYKEWFVNFRFPNYEHTEFDAESGLPVGWEIIPFSKCADFINGFAFKPHHHSESGLPIIKIKELKNGLNSETPRYKGEEVPEKYFFTDDTILFSWSADINVYWWANGESILNQHLFKVVPFENVIKEHFYFGLKNSVPEFLSRANGATMKHIKRGELDNVNYTKPNDLIAIKFQKQIKPILKQLVLINSQNQKLKEVRDILLPRLMNRMIEV